MSLSTFVIETAIIGDPSSPEKNFSVRGLNLNDLTRLLIDHAPVMMRLYQQFVEAKESRGPTELFTQDMVKDMLKQALKEAPDLVFGLIAYAADEPGAIPMASRLPLLLQLEALEQIVILSIRSEAELKKLQEIVLRIIETLTVQAVKLNLPVERASDLGFGKSAKG